MTKHNRRSGFSLIELLVVMAIVVILVTLALPNYKAAVNSAREASAMNSLKVIYTAQLQYHDRFGKYAASLAELGQPGANFIGEDLAAGVHKGYKFTLIATSETYTVNANPEPNQKGARTFYLDDNGP